ncbi:MAG: RecB family exonuclease [Patescibacteria group bacterium]
MAQDKYTAVWVSHSSIGDFLKCPRAYYLNNIYKDPTSGRKIGLVSPAMSLGQAVHQVLEDLIQYPADERIKQPLLDQLETVWISVSGRRGGFADKTQEKEYKERGREMIKRVIKNPGPLANKTVKLKTEGDMDLPHIYLSETDNIILCGKVDWLEYREEDDSVRILDFKTGKHDEKEDSLQLPIYNLLVSNLQPRKISGAYYWYLDKSDQPDFVSLPDMKEGRDRVLQIAKEIKTARENEDFQCPRGGYCFACSPFEKIINNQAEFVGKGPYKKDLYVVE